MKNNKMIGMAVLGLAVLTVIGMMLNSDGYWAVYNVITLVVCVPAGVLLLKK